LRRPVPAERRHPSTPAARRLAAIGGSASRAENLACSAVGERSCPHPLTDVEANQVLGEHERMVRARFAAIVPVLQRIAREQRAEGFVEAARRIAQAELGIEPPTELLERAWLGGLDMRALYGQVVLKTVTQLANEIHQVQAAGSGATEPEATSFLLDCGYHAVDISPCSDGRLKGLVRYVLRLPEAAIRWRRAYAGALFDVEASVQRWMEAELQRYREHHPVPPDAGTRFLKIAVYHWSSSDPAHQGCAAHGSNQRRAAAAALDRLRELRQAVENRFCCGASVDLLLIGVDTDTDAIKVHVPDGRGELSLHRAIDNLELYRQTLDVDADEARMAVYRAIEESCSRQGWGAAEGPPHDGMRRLVATLLINNLSQIEYVCRTWGGRYPDIGHDERFISVGDGFEEFQLRNLAYFAHLQTLEEGADDMDVGIRIFEKLHASEGRPIVVAVHFRYDSRVPGSRERTILKCKRVRSAIRSRYAHLERRGLLVCGMTVQDTKERSPIEAVEPTDVPVLGQDGDVR
jgi:carboxysome shell carbonic anhydrase